MNILYKINRRHCITIVFIIAIAIILSLFFKYLFELEKSRLISAEKKDIEIRTDTSASALTYLNFNIISNLNFTRKCIEDKKKNTVPTYKELGALFNTIKKNKIDIISLLYFEHSGRLITEYPAKQSISLQKDNTLFDKDNRDKLLTQKKQILFNPLKCSFTATTPIFTNGKVSGYIVMLISLKSLNNIITIPYDAIDSNKDLRLIIYDSNRNKFIYDSIYSKNIYAANSTTNSPLGKLLLKYIHSEDKGNCVLKKLDKEDIFLCSTDIELSGKNLTLFSILPTKCSTNYQQIFLSEISLGILYIFLLGISITILVIYNETIFKKLYKEITTLEIKIDKYEKESKVKEIAETEYFDDLLQRVEKMKKK